jgi:hypothetical protein
MLTPQRAAEEAARILNSDAYKKAVEDAKQRKKDEWSRTTDPSQREALWNEFQSLDAVTRELRSMRDRVKSRPQENA